MKIYILSVDKIFRPNSAPHRYPAHNKDYGIEQDFLSYLLKHKELLVDKPEESDWHYLPVFWTRWHVGHNYAKEGLPELQDEVNKCILNDKKAFTICQYADGPLVNIGKTTVFLASRNNDFGIDIPLLCSPHRKPFFKPRKKYLASFAGRLSLHPIRQEMANLLQDREDISIFDGNKGSNFFVQKVLESYISLCPRGYAGDSFRFYESMQLGVVPLLIGDIDTRPFKKFINWDEVSLYTNSVKKLDQLLETLNKSELEEMGKKASMVWKRELSYKNWCKYVIKELIDLKVNDEEKQKRQLKKSKEIDMHPNISFIIPAYNCESTIAESVESIFNRNFSDGDEVIIVDDASTDNTLKVVESLQNKYPSIKIFRHNYNKGSASAGRNTGIDNSKNDLIFCLDADNVLCPGSVPKLKEFMLSKNADAAAFGELHYFKKNIKNVTHKWIYNGEITLYDNINNSQITPCASGNYLFTKTSWIKANRYNESFSIIAFDSWAFGFYQLASGAKMITLPNSFYYHRYDYESTYIREIRKVNASLAILQIILPYINLFNDKDVDYIMSRKGRYTWWDNLGKHPIRLKSEDSKSAGFTTNKKPSNFQIMRAKIISVISHTLPNSIKEIIRGKK